MYHHHQPYLKEPKQVQAFTILNAKCSPMSEAHRNVLACIGPWKNSTRPANGPGVAKEYHKTTGTAIAQYDKTCTMFNNVNNEQVQWERPNWELWSEKTTAPSRTFAFMNEWRWRKFLRFHLLEDQAQQHSSKCHAVIRPETPEAPVPSWSTSPPRQHNSLKKSCALETGGKISI